MPPDADHVLEYTGGETDVTGMSGGADRCKNVRLGIPTVTKDGEPLLFEVPGPSLLHEGANGILLAHGPMQRAGFTIALRTGTRHNAKDGGYIRIPDGRVVNLIYENNLYYLPIHTPVSKRANRLRHLEPAPALQPSPNPFEGLLDEPLDPLTCGWTQADITTSHHSWCHPGSSKMDAIITTYPDRFPKDPAYRTAARQHRCPICDFMKGARKYRKSKRMKQKKRDKLNSKQQACANCVLPLANIPDIPVDAGRPCAAHHSPDSPLKRRVRFEPGIPTRTRLGEDDFLNAFQAKANLVMVIDGVDFLWAAPSKAKSDPESLLEEFLRYTGVTVSKIRLDAAGEFASSESFRLWCASRDIVYLLDRWL